MRKLCENHAKTMRKPCENYAKSVSFLMRSHMRFASKFSDGTACKVDVMRFCLCYLNYVYLYDTMDTSRSGSDASRLMHTCYYMYIRVQCRSASCSRSSLDFLQQGGQPNVCAACEGRSLYVGDAPKPRRSLTLVNNI